MASGDIRKLIDMIKDQDGEGSGLDADKLEGQEGSFYRNASNLNAGTVPTARLSGTYDIDISGNAATATNADKVDNFDASQTPSANTIPVAGSNGKLDEGWLPNTSGNWEQNFSQNGYTKLPNGLIIQWGSNNSSHSTITFPITFPNAVFSVIVCSRSDYHFVTVYGEPSATSFSYKTFSSNGSVGPKPIFWMALGY